MMKQFDRSVPTVCQLLFSMEVGGAEVLAKEIAEGGAGDFRFVFACLDRAGRLGEQLRAAGYTVEVFNRSPGIDLGCARRLASFCRHQSVGMVHAHTCGPFRYAALARCFAHNFPVMATEHGRSADDRRSWKRILLNRFLLRRSDRVIAVGKCVTQPLTVNEGFPASRIEVIYNGRDLDKYCLAGTDRAETRERLGLSEDDFVVMQVARLSPEKDHATSVRAAAHLATRHPRVRLIVIGDGPERTAIEQLVTETGAQANVRLLGERNDVAEILPIADAFLLSSITEAIPLTLIEAMACGVPCIATRVGGIPEVIAENETGLLVDARDERGLAAGLERLLTDPVSSGRMAIAARSRAETLFGRDTMLKAYFKRYRDMMGLPPRDIGSLSQSAFLNAS